jgi:putative Holliday junction resolvase
LDDLGRLCGIDYGNRRIGLAISDPGGVIASPLAAVEARGSLADQAQAVVEALAEFEVAGWVVGLPLNMDGSEGSQAKAARRFGEELARTSQIHVEYWDERLSSQQADEYLREADLTRKKHRARRDPVAAQVILQTFLDARCSGAS